MGVCTEIFAEPSCFVRRLRSHGALFNIGGYLSATVVTGWLAAARKCERMHRCVTKPSVQQKQGGTTDSADKLSPNSGLAAPSHASRATALPNPSWLTTALYVAPRCFFLSHVMFCHTCRHPLNE